MDAPPSVPFNGAAKWKAVAANLLIAAVGACFAAAALLAVPEDVVPIRVLGWYTVLAVVATVALAVALALTQQLPTLQRDRIGDEEALVVRASPLDWWHDLALDLGLGGAAVVLMIQGLRTEGWAVPGVLVGLLGGYLLVRVALALAGRRRNDALWLTAADVVHDSRSGRVRVSRDQVQRVSAVRGSTYLLLRVDGTQRAELCPRLWRPRRGVWRADEMILQCSRTGHEPDALETWLRDELGLDVHGSRTGGHAGRSSR